MLCDGIAGVCAGALDISAGLLFSLEVVACGGLCILVDGGRDVLAVLAVE